MSYKTLQTAYKCKVCNDYIVGEYREMVSCSCDKCAIDVGTMNTRTVGDIVWAKENWEEYYLEADANPEKIRDKLLWGNYGIDEDGNSLLDVWEEKKPEAVKKYYSNPSISLYGPRLDEVLTKKQYKEYEKWLDSKPKKEHKLMKDMDSGHILAILETQLQITDNIKEAFKIELKSRGIDASHI
jgi:hypothetical protein